jgi:hypothetical protein
MKKQGLVIIGVMAAGVIAVIAYLWGSDGVAPTASSSSAPVTNAVASDAQKAPRKEQGREPKDAPLKVPASEPKKESAQPPVTPTPTESRTPEEASQRAADPKDPSGALIIAPPIGSGAPGKSK